MQPELHSQPGSRRRMGWWFWCLLFALAFEDALIGYVGRAWGLPLVGRPWLVLVPVAMLAAFLAVQNIRLIRPGLLICFLGILVGLLIGSLSIDIPRWQQSADLVIVSARDVLAMSAAFAIGALWTLKSERDGLFLADLMLVLALVHGLVCLLALLEVVPGIFPVIDSPYWRNGRPVSRPEITTDQTRQILYIIPGLCVLFIRFTPIRMVLAVVVAALAAFVAFKVQSRWSTVLLMAFVGVAMAIGLKYRVQRPKALVPLVVVLAVAMIAEADKIAAVAADVIWRMDQIDSSFGGRLLSIQYLAEKILEPAYWLPHGYREFYQLYGAAPHSFPTMLYLMGGLLSLLCYAVLMGWVGWTLLTRVVSGRATGLDRIWFFVGGFSFLLQVTQPVITHEVFWLIIGGMVAAVSRRHGAPLGIRNGLATLSATPMSNVMR